MLPFVELPYQEVEKMNKCYKCKGILDSMYEVYYLDRNNQLVSESELEAFFILHPDQKDRLELPKVFLCGLCAFTLTK